MWIWLTSTSGTALVGLVSFSIGLFGFSLTAWGLRLTFVQAREAKRSADLAITAADAATKAVNDFRFKLDRYTAYRDISEAEFAMDACKRHLEGLAWVHASDSYDIARRAIIRVYQTAIDLPPDLIKRLKEVAEHIRLFCDKVDAAKSGKGAFPIPGKITSAIRDNYELLSAVKFAIEKDIT